MWRPIPDIIASVHHLRVAKWVVPGGLKVVGARVLDLVDKTEDLIDFLIL
jgi:hypothetical protein